MSVNTDRYENAAARYFEAWNATEPEALKKAVAAAWTADGGYTDPLADVRGHDGIAAVIAAVHEQFPGFVFRPLGWELVSGADGSAPVAGFDVVTLDDEGRIRQVLGFLDRVPPTA
jgi:hypothetical protein